MTLIRAIRHSALAAILAAAGFNAAAADMKPIETGLQLYSLRAEFVRYGVPNTLDKIEGFGIHKVELAGTYNLPAEKFKSLLEEHHLQPVSGHFSYDLLRDNVAAAVAEAKLFGLEYAGCAWVPHKDDFDEEECRGAAKVFNAAGEAFAKEGIKFFYHPHGYEFIPYGDGTLLDLLFAETNPENVFYEMDVFWVHHAGQKPVDLLRKYKGRWKLMHLKDMQKGVETGFTTGHTDVKFNVVIGTGQMDWPSILKVAQRTGVKYYFIEDESPSAETQIPLSLTYLNGLK